MRRTMVVSAALILGCVAIAGVEARADSSSPTPASALTREQFVALPPDAVIEVDGGQMTKREFIERRTKAVEQARRDAHEARTKAEAEIEARRKEFLAAEKAKLEEANKKVDTEIARLVGVDSAAHGPNWGARKTEATALLKEAETGPPDQRSQLEKKASELLSPRQ
jgi:hypothetical protein